MRFKQFESNIACLGIYPRIIITILIAVIYVLGVGHYKECGLVAFGYYGIVFFIALNLSSRNFSIVLLLILSLYFPTGMLYGYPADEIVFALLQTDTYEIWGYLLATKIQWLIVFCFWVLLFFYKRLQPLKTFQKDIYKIVGNVVLVATLILPIPSQIEARGGVLTVLTNAIEKVITVQNERRVYTYKNNDMLVDKIQENLKILVIGESVRRDYMSCYGYPLITTPFLNKASGVFVDGYIASGPNTQLSLKYSLFKSDQNGEVNFQKNLLNIAKYAGYRIYWLSNQGKSGWGDDFLYELASLADERIFIKSGSFNSSNEDDFDLLEILKQKSSDLTSKSFVVIHMMGSHEPVCSRLGKEVSEFGRHTELNCYLSSIHKLDNFLKQLVSWAREHDPNAEVMYFSDHALSVAENRIFHDNDLKNEYEVPFFLLSEEVNLHRVRKLNLSAFNFLDIFANWFGVSAPWIQSGYNLKKDIVSDEKIMVFYRGLRPFDQIKRSQSTLIPSSLESVKFERVKSVNCIGNIDNNTKLNIIDGWVACKTKGGDYITCPKVGLYKQNSDAGDEFVMASKVKRQDVNNYLQVNKDIDFGFSVFNPYSDGDVYVGFMDGNKLWYCRNLKVGVNEH